MEEMNLKLTFENNWNRSCLVVDTSAPYTEDYQIKMLKNNSVPGLLKIAGNGLEGKSRYTYPVQELLPFSQKYTKQKISFSTLNLLINQLIDLTHVLGNYLLNPDCILLHPDCIFEPREPSEQQAKQHFYFCYVPSFSGSLSDSFHKLTEFIVQNLDYNDDNGILLACLLHKETLQKNYHLESLLQSCRKEAARREEQETMSVNKNRKMKLSHPTPDQTLTNTSKVPTTSATLADSSASTAPSTSSRRSLPSSETRAKSTPSEYLPPEDFEEFEDELLIQSRRGASEASILASEALSYPSEENSMPLMEEKRYRPFKRFTRTIKNTHWGNWDDLITEADEYEP